MNISSNLPRNSLLFLTIAAACLAAGTWIVSQSQAATHPPEARGHKPFVMVTRDNTISNAAEMVLRGREIFRFDTYGDEAFWGDTLQLHRAIEGTSFGGVGAGVSPKAALSLGLKVDADALPHDVVQALNRGKLDLDSP